MKDPGVPEPPLAAAPKEPDAGEPSAPPVPDGGTEGGSGAPPEGQDALRTLMDRNFLSYASYVICERAIPNLDDGLKPVQRRILHALHEKDDGRFIKVANVVGHCMQYHPHGDASITDALVTLVNKGYLIEGQGNFGNLLTGDRAAASRYIECRLTDLARKELFNKDLTRFVPSYDGRNREPAALPAKLPLLLLLGADGIAVGLSTRVLPHNLAELLEAQIAVLKEQPFELAPDFPQGGLLDASQYNAGNGKVRVRARLVCRDRDRIAVTELPYGATTESLIASIEDAVRKKKVPVRSIDDFTAEHVNIELALAPEASPQKAIEALYAFTACESTVACHATVIHAGRPRAVDVAWILRENTRQLLKVLRQELLLARRRFQEKIHAKTLVRLFVEHGIYKRLEACRSHPELVEAVQEGLAPLADRLERPVTKQDVDMLLGLPIRSISWFDGEKNRKEIETLQKGLAKVERRLENVPAHAVQYVRGLLNTYGASCPRRTEISRFEAIEVRDLTARELELCYDRGRGYLGSAVKEGRRVLECSSYDRVVLVWRDGRFKIVAPPENLFVDKGLIYCGKLERDRVLTLVYTRDGVTYLKRFTIGASAAGRELRCAARGARVLLLADDDPEHVYVKYRPAPGQRYHQQVFRARDLAVRPVKAEGAIMAPKQIEKIAARKPRWWSQAGAGPPGVLWEA